MNSSKLSADEDAQKRPFYLKEDSLPGLYYFVENYTESSQPAVHKALVDSTKHFNLALMDSVDTHVCTIIRKDSAVRVVPVEFTAIQVGGASGTTASTGIQITFDTIVTGLTDDNIILTNGTGAATKGALTGSGTTWTIALSAVAAEGNVTVAVANWRGFDVTTSPQTVTIYQPKQIPTIDDLDFTIPPDVNYDGLAHSVTVRAKPGVIGLGTITVRYNGVITPPIAAGNYNVTVDIAESVNYQAVNLLLGIFTILPKPTPNVGDLDFTLPDVDYDGLEHPVIVRPKDGVTGLGAITVRYNGVTAPPKEVNNYNVTVDIAEGIGYLPVNWLFLGTFKIQSPSANDAPDQSTLVVTGSNGQIYVRATSGEAHHLQVYSCRACWFTAPTLRPTNFIFLPPADRCIL
jgi:hypothetical protein